MLKVIFNEQENIFNKKTFLLLYSYYGKKVLIKGLI